MESELLQWMASTGGTSGIILIGMWKMWNGTGKRIIEIDKRLVRVETKLEE